MTDPSFFATGLAWYVIFLLSTVLHEAAHALAAKLGGDETGASQVTLDPLPHITREPWGMVLVPFLSYAVLGGWMMGWASTPYDPYWADRYPHRAARMALAGPLANLAIALMAGAVMFLGLQNGWFTPLERIGVSSVVGPAEGQTPALALMLSIAFSLNLLLFVFNLIPLPPLDGSAVVGLFMPESMARRWQLKMRDPALVMPAFLIAMALASRVVYPVWSFGIDVVYRAMGA